MTPEELKRDLLRKFQAPLTTIQLRQILIDADKKLDEARIPKTEKDIFYADLVTEAQDNSTTMNNGREAEDIINDLRKK